MKPKKKNNAPEPQSTFMVRLPTIYREQLKLLQKTERRSLTAEVILAVEQRLKEKGLWPPSSDTST